MSVFWAWWTGMRCCGLQTQITSSMWFPFLCSGSMGAGLLFCFFSLADVISALVVIRILLQFLLQAVGVIVLRIRRPEMPRPFRMWLYPVPAILAMIGFSYIVTKRHDSLKEIRYAAVILVVGLIIYF